MLKNQTAATIPYQSVLYVLAWAVFVMIFLKNAWIADDAYISFRSIEQVFAGNGLRWNIDERVQVYTSPLWFMLQLGVRLLTDNLFVAVIVLSFLCCAGALWMARKLFNDNINFLLFVLFISGCWSVMDFSSSGLENPLLYLLVSIYLFYYFQYFSAVEDHRRRHCFSALLLVLGLLSITRHDVATLVFFPTLWLGLDVLKRYGIKAALLKIHWLLLPLFLWSVFSLIYYGVPFPNTAYAKMSHGVARAELMDFGWLYLKVSFRYDTFALLVLLALTVRVIWKRELPIVFVWLGVLSNFAYVVYVGGDFMLGRFLSVAIFAAALALCLPQQQMQNDQLPDKDRRWVYAVLLTGLMLWLTTPLKLSPDSGFEIDKGQRHFSWRGILNERNFYFKTNSLWAYLHRDTAQPFPNHKWCKKGLNARQQGKNAAKFGGIGMYGYCAGLELIIIDNLALADPFLARLPKPPELDWRAGHFNRLLPRGYRKSRLSGENHLVNPQLQSLWQDVMLATRAPLWEEGRWSAIWRLNSGYYREIGPVYLADLEQRQ